MTALKLSDELHAKVAAEAERRGVAVDQMVEAVIREWIDEAAECAISSPDSPGDAPDAIEARRQYDEVMEHLAQQPGITRIAPPDKPVAWEPVALAGKPLSEIIIEERGER